VKAPAFSPVTFSFVFAVGLAMFGTLCLAGCPKNACFIQVCTNGKCECPVNSCAEGADFDLEKNTCVCKQGLFAVNGQCMTPQQADGFCGKGRRWGVDQAVAGSAESGGGCIAKTCPPEQQLDEGTGECKALGDVAAAAGVTLGQGETLGCPAGQKLVVEGQNSACVPIEQTCAPDEVFNGSACVKGGACPTGSAFDPSSKQCVAFGSGGGDGFTVDVPSWAQTNYGRDGQLGTPAFCGKFSRKPWSFGVSEGQSAMVQVKVALSFPDTAIGAAQVQTDSRFDNSGNAVPQKGAELVKGAAEELLGSLRVGGGKASVPQHALTVKCPVVNAAKPIVVPTTGGV
jgi:hypothetical protein